MPTTGRLTRAPAWSRIPHTLPPAIWFVGGARLQARLEVGAADDPLEHEADTVAEQVLRMPDAAAGPVHLTGSGGGTVQRACACGGGGDAACPTCAEERLRRQSVQRQSEGKAAGGEAPASVHAALGTPGQPLDAATRAFMEPRFGMDFGGVRVHTDGQAAESARAVGALAYTVGQDVVFGAGQYAPSSARGSQLLAHELTHVIQQGGMGTPRGAQRQYVRRQPTEEVTEESSEASTAEPGTVPTGAAPEFGSFIFDPSCPRTPTRLGDLPPEPPCRASDEDVHGERFRFCKDTDVFLDQDDPNRLVTFARSQPAHTLFNVFGYASKDGATGYNLNLSCHRAKRVARDLVNAGVRPERVDIVARGETERFSAGNSEARLAPNRAVVVRTEVPPTPPSPSGPLPTDRRALVDLAIARLERGEYRLAADAYIAFWSCGLVPSLAEAVRRTRIEISRDPCPFPAGRTLGFPIRFDPNHPFSLNAIQLSADTFCAADPLECVLGRIIDMSFHHMVRQQIPNIDTQHAPALFLVELAGFSPCRTINGQPYWRRVTRDPLLGQPDPTCAVAPLPGPLVTPLGQGRVPRAVPVFQVDQASARGHRGSINFTVSGGAGTMAPPGSAFELNATVTMSGDPGEFPNYEIGYIQTLTLNDTTADYVAGQRVRTLLPVPIRDGPPAILPFARPPWFDARFIGVPNATTGITTTRMTDAPSRTAPLEFFERNNVLNRMDQHLIFNNWLVARRRNAPLDRFNTFFLDGTLIDLQQSVDVIGGTGTGTFNAQVNVSTDETNMQLSDPTPADIPLNLQLSLSEPRPRASAGGLPFVDFIRRVNQIAEPPRRALGLRETLSARIRIVPQTGHVALDTPNLAGGAITITLVSGGASTPQLGQLARAIFPEVRKLVLAPDPRLRGQDIPVTLNPLSP